MSDLLGTVESGKADVAVAGITITSEREGKDFLHAFYESGLQVLTRKEAATYGR